MRQSAMVSYTAVMVVCLFAPYIAAGYSGGAGIEDISDDLTELQNKINKAGLAGLNADPALVKQYRKDYLQITGRLCEYDSYIRDLRNSLGGKHVSGTPGTAVGRWAGAGDPRWPGDDRDPGKTGDPNDPKGSKRAKAQDKASSVRKQLNAFFPAGRKLPGLPKWQGYYANW